MTQFITWLKIIDTKFRAAYLAKTEEKIQDIPLESEDGLSYMVGSSRVTQKQLDELKSDTNITENPDDISTRKNLPPVGWVQKHEELIE